MPFEAGIPGETRHYKRVIAEDNFIRSHLIMNQESKIRFPSGVKPAYLATLGGPAEAVPFQNRFMR